MAEKREIETVLECYPRIYFACHVRHVRDTDANSKTPKVLSANQASVLDHLDTNDGTLVNELASHMGVSASTMSLTLDRLERDGYVNRCKDVVDARRTFVYLTEAGERIKRKQKVLDPKLIDSLLDRMQPEQRADALAGLRALAQAADELIRSKHFPKLKRK